MSGLPEIFNQICHRRKDMLWGILLHLFQFHNLYNTIIELLQYNIKKRKNKLLVVFNSVYHNKLFLENGPKFSLPPVSFQRWSLWFVAAHWLIFDQFDMFSVDESPRSLSLHKIIKIILNLFNLFTIEREKFWEAFGKLPFSNEKMHIRPIFEAWID